MTRRELSIRAGERFFQIWLLWCFWSLFLVGMAWITNTVKLDTLTYLLGEIMIWSSLLLAIVALLPLFAFIILIKTKDSRDKIDTNRKYLESKRATQRWCELILVYNGYCEQNTQKSKNPTQYEPSFFHLIQPFIGIVRFIIERLKSGVNHDRREPAT